MIKEQRYIDGAIIANNPSWLAVREVESVWGRGVGVEVVVSVGTGGEGRKGVGKGVGGVVGAMMGRLLGGGEVEEWMEWWGREGGGGRWERWNVEGEVMGCGLDETREEKWRELSRVSGEWCRLNKRRIKRVARICVGDLGLWENNDLYFCDDDCR